MLFAANAKAAALDSRWSHDAAVITTRNVRLVQNAPLELTQQGHALPHRTRCAQSAKLVQRELALPHHPESRVILPSQSWQDGPLFTTSCRATILSRTKSTDTRAKETGCSWVARGPLVPTRLSWVPSVAELTCSSRLAAQALLRRTTRSSGTTNPENQWVSHP